MRHEWARAELRFSLCFRIYSDRDTYMRKWHSALDIPRVAGSLAQTPGPKAQCDNKPNMRRSTARLIVLTYAATLTAQNPNSIINTAMTAKIRAEAMSGASEVSTVFDTLTIDIGPRLTNSPAYYRAVDFRRRQN